MLLTYIDESGISYERLNQKGAFFVDGPFAIYGGMLINDRKYFHLERLFSDLLKKSLGISNWRLDEVHAAKLWNKQGNFSVMSTDKIYVYFEELIQLVTKLRIDFVVGFQKKNAQLRSKKSKDEEVMKAAYAMLTALEHRLGELNESTIIIADDSDKKVPLQNMLYDRTKWRYNSGERASKSYPSRYYFENQSCFILDQIHYVDSKKSLFTLIIDHICYILMRVLTFEHIKENPASTQITADPAKVPISPGTFHFFSDCVKWANFNQSLKDVTLMDGVMSTEKHFGTNTYLEYTYFKGR